MRVERVDVAQDLPRVLELLGVKHLAAHHEAQGAARVHHVAPDAARQVFVARNRAEHLAGQLVGHVARQHLGADLLQVDVDAFDGVGRILGVGIEELEQHVFGVVDQAHRPARAHAHQPKHWHVLVVNGKQHPSAFVLAGVHVQNEGHPHGVRLFGVCNQEVRADV